LCKKIKEFNRSEEVAYDLLANAGISFSAPSNKDNFTREIKLFLNTLITETKTQYDNFKKTMEEIFAPSNEEGRTTGEVEYLINSKIKLSTQEYTEEEIETPGLQLKGPEMLRILLKWMETLTLLIYDI
jgi:hypothetical protein